MKLKNIMGGWKNPVRRAAGICLLAVLSLSGQEYRATLLGVINDSSGASVPGARVTVTNIESGVRSKTEAGPDGTYLVPFLLPGSYGLMVEREGFKAYRRSPVELRVNDRTRIDVKLEVGQITEQVTVSAESPLLEMASASNGQVIGNQAVTYAPLSGGNVFQLAQLAPGVQFAAANLKWQRPYDNGAWAELSINGGRSGSNEFLIDGVSNTRIMQNSRNDGSYVPPTEATQEFKVQTNSYDAQYGRTGGGIINVSIKPGTNRFHGVGYESMRRVSLRANETVNNANRTRRPDATFDQYGFEIEGPVTLPKLYRGKDRTFFMFALEKMRKVESPYGQTTVPTQAERGGDFSQTFAPNGSVYTIHDPLTVHLNPNYVAGKPISAGNLQYIRDPFPRNMVPKDRINATAPEVMKDIPLPNASGDPVTHINNLYDVWSGGYKMPYKNIITRVDHTFTERWKVFGRFNHNGRQDPWWNPHRMTGRSEPGYKVRANYGSVLDAVGTLGPTTIVSLRAGYNWFVDGDYYKSMDPYGLGLPKNLVSQLPAQDLYPTFELSGFLMPRARPGPQSKPAQQSSETYGYQASLTRIQGPHSMKFGGEYRILHDILKSFGDTAGTYNFNRGWTSLGPEADSIYTGNSIASFLLGYMSSAVVTMQPQTYTSWHYRVLYFQDDWQVNRRLTLNLGLRWDFQSPAVERHNRQNRGFDFTARSPYQVPGYDLRGGALFAGANGAPRGAFNPDRSNWQPRVGLAYRVLDAKPLVFRAGVGRFYLPTVDTGGMVGFSQSTNVQTGTANYLPYHTLANPYPNGLIPVPGASLGLKTQVGDAYTFNDPTRKIPYVWQYSAGFQYELTPGFLMDATYSGSRTQKIGVGKSINYLTPEQLAMGTAYLSAAVPNPFYGVLPIQTSRGGQASIQRRNLLLAYPQFSGLTANNQSIGRSWYNAFQFKAERRLKHGLSLLASYTVSKNMEAAQFKNPQDAQLARELAAFDMPQLLTLNGIYALPVGPGKTWLNRGIGSHLIGGWVVSFFSLMQSGVPVGLSDWDLRGDPRLAAGQTLNRWFNTSKDLWIQRAPDTLRTTALRSPNIRRHTRPQYDVSLTREFRIREGHIFQFKANAYNITNTPLFNFPDTNPASAKFGRVDLPQRNDPRQVELGLRYAF